MPKTNERETTLSSQARARLSHKVEDVLRIYGDREELQSKSDFIRVTLASAVLYITELPPNEQDKTLLDDFRKAEQHYASNMRPELIKLLNSIYQVVKLR